MLTLGPYLQLQLKYPKMELLYVILIAATLLQVFVFVLLSMPSPPGVKGTLAELLSASRKTQLILLGHLSFCLIAGLLFADCYRMEEKYRAERDFLLHNKNVGTEIRTAELSYKMLLVQRNKYITFGTIFVSVFLNIYISLLRYMYGKRDKFQLNKAGGDTKVFGASVEAKPEAKKIN